ncbi:MAG: 30S ribosomal protein S3 [bacterium]
MGQKVHPKAYRLGVNKTWDSKWFADEKDFANVLRQDILIRKFITVKLKEAGVSKVEIERSANGLIVNIIAAKPGIVIGRGGAGVEDLKKEIRIKFLKDGFSRKKGIKNLNLNIVELEHPGQDAAINMQSIIADLEKRVAYRRAVKQAISRAEKAGVKGIKVIVGGRLNGAEIARRETFFSGKIPLHTLRADIDYCRGAAHTMYGAIGVKVWIYRGDIFNEKEKAKAANAKK